MARENSSPIRADPKFIKEIRDMQLKRITKNKDNPLKPKSPRRITLAMTRHPEFKKIKEDIIKADLK